MITTTTLLYADASVARLEDEKQKKFDIDLAMFAVQYEVDSVHSADPLFTKGDWVRIEKECPDKGTIVRVEDPSCDGLVQVRYADKDETRRYAPQDLSKVEKL